MTQQGQLELYDVTIIGGGPAGLYSAFYSGMRDMKTKIIEFNPTLGGKILLYPEKMIWDVGGVPPISGAGLIQNLTEQAMVFDPTVVLNQQITGLERLEDNTILLTSNTGEQHHTRTVILALGHGIPKMRKLEIEGADRYEVTNLHYTVQELAIFKDKHIVISGGGDSAVDWANALHPLAASVTVVHRREEFGGHERNVISMKQNCKEVITSYELTGLQGQGSLVEEITICHVESKETRTLKVDALIVNHGMTSDLSPLLDWGMELGEYNKPIIDERRQTSISGVFAAGDLVQYDGKLYLISGALVDGATAVNSAKQYLEPEAYSQAYVSSHNKKFEDKNKQLEQQTVRV
ncbi:NAD(P)/FAD-dependent oxidoreductase [Paenibacillus kandeliae]|uniref:NAD(P)/FAD-dependent oxidoreductase n=1 Tax=Paenibacillus kandeliae TaxID=3231269 RepID=UPI0034597444